MGKPKMDQQQKKALATSKSNLEQALKKNKRSGILHWFTKTRNFFNSFGKNVKQMPLWKKDDSECLLAWEPSVKCFRTTTFKSCSKDTQCSCGAGCSGMGVT